MTNDAPTEVTYNQTLAQVIPSLENILQSFRDHPQRDELVGIDPDTAFELGYETAVHDLKRLTGDDPVDLGIIVYQKEDSDDER